jgi:hypothetical protein
MNTAFHSVKISSGGSKRPISGQLKEKRRSSGSLYIENTGSLKQISSTAKVKPTGASGIEPLSHRRDAEGLSSESRYVW